MVAHEKRNPAQLFCAVPTQNDLALSSLLFSAQPTKKLGYPVERDRGFPVFCMEWGGKEGEFVFPLSFSGEIRYNLYLTEI